MFFFVLDITVVCKPDYIEVVLMQANFPGIIVNDSVLHLEDVACVAGYKDAEMVKFTFDLDSCKTMIKVERDMVYYMNSVYLTADPETDGSEITRKNAQVIPFSCGYEKKATLSKISYSPRSTLVITDAGKYIIRVRRCDIGLLVTSLRQDSLKNSPTVICCRDPTQD